MSRDNSVSEILCWLYRCPNKSVLEALEQNLIHDLKLENLKDQHVHHDNQTNIALQRIQQEYSESDIIATLVRERFKAQLLRIKIRKGLTPDDFANLEFNCVKEEKTPALIWLRPEQPKRRKNIGKLKKILYKFLNYIHV